MFQCQQGRPEAFRVLTERYWRLLLWQLRLMVGNEAEAEELVADSFTSLLSYVPTWTPEGRVKPLLMTIARRRGLRARKQGARHRALPLGPGEEADGDVQLPDQSPDPEAQVQLVEDLARIDAVLTQRPLNEQRAFDLHFRQHQEVEDVARNLEASAGTVRVWLSRTREAIRRAFQAEEALELPSISLSSGQQRRHNTSVPT